MKTPAATNTAGKKSGGERGQKRARDNSGPSVCPHSVCVCLLHLLCPGKSSEFLSHHQGLTLVAGVTSSEARLCIWAFFFWKDGSLQTLCLGPWIQRVFVGSHSFTAALCHRLFSPLKAMETRRLSLAALSCTSSHCTFFLLLLSLSHRSSLPW